MNTHREENPFEDTHIAQEWINSVEGEKDMFRDNVIYPSLKEWSVTFDASSALIEVGAGQGICSEHVHPDAHYIGIEPSIALVDRAKEKYPAPNREFVVGNAYQLPIADGVADGAFSVNVWFHLENLERASNELARVLKVGAPFLIITANPDAYDLWEDSYISPQREGKKLIGKVKLPVNSLSKNVFYKHSLQEMVADLEDAGFEVKPATVLGGLYKRTPKPLFISITGRKS